MMSHKAALTNQDHEDDLLRYKDLVKRFGLSESTIRRLVKAGELEVVMAHGRPRFTRREMERYYRESIVGRND